MRANQKKMIFRHPVLWTSLIVLLLLTGIFILWPGYQILRATQDLRVQIGAVRSQVHTKNLTQVPEELQRIDHDLHSLRDSAGMFGYLRIVPGFGNTYRSTLELLTAAGDGTDGLEVMMPDLIHTAPFLGYRTSLRAASAGSGQGRVNAFLQSLPTMSLALNHARTQFEAANAAFQQVDPHSLPHFITRKIPIGLLQSFSNRIVHNIPSFSEWAGFLQQVLGEQSPQRYFVIFQNSGELRPTGGFMTAYSLITVNKGKPGPIDVNNTYSLLNKVTYRPPAPAILHYVYTMHWHIRDANLSPNLPTTVGYINRFYSSIAGAPKLNGMIFINTWLVDDLLKVTGPLTMPAQYHHLVITAKNANYEMEFMAERSGFPSSTRKAFIGIMMKALMKRVLNSHGTELAQVAQTVSHGLSRKYILLYFNDPAAENLVEHYNWGDTMNKQVSGDYLEVVDANLGGHKDNYFMHYKITVDITKHQGRYFQSVRMTWINPAVLDGWLIVPYLSWLRVYVPEGSKLINILNGNGVVYDYNNTTVDKMVFGEHISLPGRASLSDPPAKGSMVINYELPKGISMRTLTMQKQAGIRSDDVQINMGPYHKNFILTQDVVVPLSKG
jgi:hypothetical protein